jgi:hypothetical protein
MPIPKPRSDESKKDFISRCMGDATMVDEYDQEQRAGICYGQWDKKKNKNNLKLFRCTQLKTPARFGTLKFNITDVRHETEDGKEYLVAPVVAIKEGVLNGEFVPANEIAKSASDWEGIPLTVGHPKQDGDFVSIHLNPEILDEAVGTFKNVKFEQDSLKGELWIDIEKASNTEAGQEALNILEEGGMLEVSTGYFAEETIGDGAYRGESYIASQKNITPDHLALLPYEVGACSVEDGCGAPRTNKIYEILGRGGDNTMPNTLQNAFEFIAEHLGFTIHKKEQYGLKVHGDNLSTLLNKIINDQNAGENRPKREIVKQMADLAGISKDQVQKVLNGDIDFIPRRWLEGFAQALDIDIWDMIIAANLDSMKFVEENLPGFKERIDEPSVFSANLDEENIEDDKSYEDTKEVKEIMTKEEKVNNIIANEDNTFTEEDRDALGSLDENFLDKLGFTETEEVEEEPVTQEDHDCECGEHVETTEEEVVAQEEETTEEEVVAQEEAVEEEVEEEEVVEEVPTLEDFLNSMPDEMKNQVKSAITAQNAYKNKLISKIVENSELTPEELSEEPIEKLEKLASLTTKEEVQADYSGLGGPRAHSKDENEVPPTPAIILKK